MSNARGGPYLVDFVAHNNFDDWSMDVCCYLREPARELFKGLTTSCVIYFEDRVSDCGDTENADQRTKKDALCTLVMGQLHGAELFFTRGILFH
jgi:hypothetical protein